MLYFVWVKTSKLAQERVMMWFWKSCNKGWCENGDVNNINLFSTLRLIFVFVFWYRFVGPNIT